MNFMMNGNFQARFMNGMQFSNNQPPTFDGNLWGNQENTSNDELLADDNFATPNGLQEIMPFENRFEFSFGNFGGNSNFGGFGGEMMPAFGGNNNQQNPPQAQPSFRNQQSA